MTGNSGAPGGSEISAAPACTNFENLSHQSLYDMVAGADHMEIGLMGTSLMAAGNEIRKITADLKGYVDQVRWEGEGAEAFRTWSRDTISESHKLADYAHTAGSAMTDSATALGRAKLMPKPKPPANVVELDPDRTGPTTSLLKDPDRDAAVTEMNRLSSYYRNAQERIARQEQPNFRPAEGFVPPPPNDSGHIDDAFFRVPGSAANQTAARSANAGATVPHGGGVDEQHVAPPQPTPHAAPEKGSTSTSLDSAAHDVLPAAPPADMSTTPPQSGSSHESPRTFLPGTVTPPRAATHATGPTTTPRAPVADRPGTVERPRGKSAGDGIVGGTARRNNAPGAPRIPAGTVMGEEHGVNAPRQTGPAGTPSVRGGGTAPNGEERLRQRLLAPRSGSAQVPHGTAMGEELGASGHGPTGSGYPGYAGGSVRDGARGVTSRRLAFEPGGPVGASPSSPVVGGEPDTRVPRPTRSVPESASATEAARTGGRAGDFTPGGTGLRRESSANEVRPMAGEPSSRQRRRTSTKRPAYLQEDNETWAAPQPPVVPPVIGEDAPS
ncbi:hypothetical protein ABZ616_18655 [Streptomyces noursei]|uniref:WXG100 family type VII secretion target n=1 Tax=Streptomyces noursei TaxID=1971 RepID=UPI00340B10CA